MARILTPPQYPKAPKFEMLDCDICGAKKSANQIVILPNELAQEGINKCCVEHADLAAREFYAPIRARFAAMKEESEWKR